MSGLIEHVQEQIEQIVESAEAVADEAETYIDKASDINHQHWVNSSRDRIPLDHQPFGEELARLGKSPDALRALVQELQSIPLGETPLAKLEEQLEEAQEFIESVRSTLQDIPEIPDDDDDDEFPS